ncbi:MAG: DNA polymerase, partial [Pseudomonadota bacterium]
MLVTIDANELVGLHLALGWRVPERVVDLMVEFRNATNGRPGRIVGGLAGALLWFDRSAAYGLVGGTSPEQMRRRLKAVAHLFEAMRDSLDLARALLRGRYMSAVAHIEAAGIPVDERSIRRIASNWPVVRDRVIEIIDRRYGVYRGRRLDVDAFAHWLDQKAIAWPLLDSGRLDLSDDAFREMTRAHPAVRPLKELRTTLIGFDPGALTIGRDGRNRTPLRPFASRTGRNQPSTKATVIGTAAWVRHLIRPHPGTGIALIDWQQQEFGIAAALSDDPAMQDAYS